MSEKKTIMLLDDERTDSEYYVRELKIQLPEFQTIERFDVDSAISYIKASGPQCVAIVPDIMMPKSKIYTDDLLGIELHDGLNTGIWFLEYIRREIEEHKIRVLSITNRNVNEVRYLIGERKFSKGLVEAFSKDVMTPDLLPKYLLSMIERKLI